MFAAMTSRDKPPGRSIHVRGRNSQSQHTGSQINHWLKTHTQNNDGCQTMLVKYTLALRPCCNRKTALQHRFPLLMPGCWTSCSYTHQVWYVLV
jgi:hypothetical protein